MWTSGTGREAVHRRSRTQSEPVRRWRLSRDLVVPIIVLLAFVPFLILLGRNLWSQPHYQFFPIIVIGFLLQFRSRWPATNDAADTAATHRSNRLSVGLLVLSWILLAGSVAVFSPWMSGIAALFVIASALLHLSEPGTVRRFVGPWCLLWLIIPLPFRLDYRLIEWLQATTSRLASLSLDRIGIRHLMVGNILEFPERRMLVEEACSGIHSLYALAACVGLFVVWLRLRSGEYGGR